jgi:hypothetical protein
LGIDLVEDGKKLKFGNKGNTEFFFSVHGSTLRCNRCCACREAHKNLADESACLMERLEFREVINLWTP